MLLTLNINGGFANIYSAKKLRRVLETLVARFNDVHTSGYTSAGSVWILLKFGELRVYCLELALTDFGRDPHRSQSGTASQIFVFLCQVNNALLYRFPVSQISRNLHTRRGAKRW